MMAGRVTSPAAESRLPDAGSAGSGCEKTGQVVFGKRAHPPLRQVPTSRERLATIAAELNLLFANRVEADQAFATLSEQNQKLALRVGRVVGLAAVVEIEEEAGFFVLFEHGPGEVVFMTTSERRLIDHIVSLTTAAFVESLSRVPDHAARPSIAAVEEGLVMSTLLKFQGNCRRAALALGIDDAVLHARLQRYFQTRSRPSSSVERGS